MKRNNIFIIQWIVWLCVTLTACSGIEDELSSATQANDSSSETRANLVEYTIEVETAGTLGSLVESRGYSDAQKLIVTGKIDYNDVNYVDVNMPTVEVLDLSRATYNSTSLSGKFLSSSTSIKEISLPGNMTSITGSVKGNGFSYTLSSYGPFNDCSSLTRITLPDGLTDIESGAFYGCSSLTSITIPESVTSIGSCVFQNCSSLTSITISESVTNIGNNAFYDCSSLTSITIPKSVTNIGNYAFYRCSSLTSITIPESVTEIGSAAFYGCSSSMKVYWNCALSINTGIFDSNPLLIYTQDGSIPVGADKYEYVIVNDVAEKFDLNDWKNNFDFSIDSIFAKQVIFKKSFSGMGGSYNRWYTISLPFKPTQITHEEKGTIAPFDSNIEGAKNFWLRELTPDGYQDVTEIEANHAYIIAMPTNKDYSSDLRLDGYVTFSAENVTLIWGEPIVSVGPTYSMYPTTFKTEEQAKDVYALNSQYWVDGYNYGSVWVHSAMDVGRFEAYVKLNEGAATMRSVLPMADGKRTAVRGASSSSDASTRGVYGQRKPRKEDM
jgi:hypothetical protein